MIMAVGLTVSKIYRDQRSRGSQFRTIYAIKSESILNCLPCDLRVLLVINTFQSKHLLASFSGVCHPVFSFLNDGS